MDIGQWSTAQPAWVRHHTRAALMAPDGIFPPGAIFCGVMTLEPAAIRAWATEVTRRVGRLLVGVETPLQLVLVAALARGHVLIEDVPGVGKTRLAEAVARCLGVVFRRIQFTPDVLPSDVTGTSVLDPAHGTFRFRAGPIFSGVVLADEINRATPRTQSSLLEAMEERQVSVDGVTRALPEPFLVLATQNPVELEGTFPLPEAQLDRFLLRLHLGYPSEAAEREMLERLCRVEGAADLMPTLDAVPLAQGLPAASATVRKVHVARDVIAYIAAMVRATRVHSDVRLGASPRAAGALLLAAQAHAVLHGRDAVVPDDVKALAGPVLGHRLLLTVDAQLHGRGVEETLDEVVASVPVPVEPEAAVER
jgi:MoxR-like ATPase